MSGTTTYIHSYLYLPSLHFVDDCSTYTLNHDHDAFDCHKNTDKMCVPASCQQTPVFDIERTKHYHRHQQALQIIHYLGSCLGVVTRYQRSKDAHEQSNSFSSKACTTKLELQAGNNYNSDHHYLYCDAYQLITFTVQYCIDCDIIGCQKLVTFTV